MRYWFGFWQSAPTTGNSDTPAVRGVGLRYSTGASDTGFRLVASTGSVFTTGTQLGTVLANEEYMMTIQIQNGQMNVTINERGPRNIVTNSGSMGFSPTGLFTGLTLSPYIDIQSIDGNAKFVDVSAIGFSFGNL